MQCPGRFSADVAHCTTADLLSDKRTAHQKPRQSGGLARALGHRLCNRRAAMRWPSLDPWPIAATSELAEKRLIRGNTMTQPPVPLALTYRPGKATWVRRTVSLNPYPEKFNSLGGMAIKNRLEQLGKHCRRNTGRPS